MGSSESTSMSADRTIISNSDIAKHQKEISDLKLDVENKEITILNLRNMNVKLRDDISKKSILSMELTDKCNNLTEQTEKLRSELDKYESLPVLKQMLNLYERLREFLVLTESVKKDDSIETEFKDLKTQIQNMKSDNMKLENELAQKSYKLTNTNKVGQLFRAEKVLHSIQEESQNLSLEKLKLPVLMKKLTESADQLDKLICNNFEEVTKQLEDNEKNLHRIQSATNEIKQRKRDICEGILGILREQNESLTALSKVPHITSQTSNSDVTNTKKWYYVVIHNLDEQEDGISDAIKVKNIIDSICNIQNEEIQTCRIGHKIAGKIRPIKVFLPTFYCLRQILSNTGQLQNGSYRHIRIVPYRKDTKIRTIENE